LRTTLSRILNGAAGISAEMSLRLSDALGTHAKFWYDLQHRRGQQQGVDAIN
jgi:antitoxin HigA-1